VALYYVAVGAAAFVIGAIPFSWLLGKWGARVDLRRVGSGNPGATNLYRVAGAAWGIPGLFFDAAKGFGPVLAAVLLFPTLKAAGVVAATAAIAGHVWTPFLGFRGGKGVATGAGAFLALNPWLVLFAVAAFVAVVAFTRYVSLGSLTAVGVAFIGSFVIPAVRGRPLDVPFVVFCGVAAAVIVFSHRKNIRRMIAGEESKWGAATPPGK